MTKIPELHPILGAWLLEGPLSAQVPAYVARLKRGRYATHTCARCLNAVAHFAHWMSMCHLPACMFDEGCIDQFLRCHLPRCDCLGGALRTPNEAHAALVLMLEILRVEGVIARPTAPAGPIADELRSYDAHMRDARGLASGTRTGRLRIVERLLVSQFAARPVVVGELQTDDIRQFIADQLDALGSTSNAITIASTLRAYLRYRATCGEAVQPLLAVIASPAHWSMASLPRAQRIACMDQYLLEGLKAWQPQLDLLQTILGIDIQRAAMMLVEIGADVTVCGSAERLASWAGTYPSNNESAGKRKSGRVRRGNAWARRLLREFLVHVRMPRSKGVGSNVDRKAAADPIRVLASKVFALRHLGSSCS